MKKIFFLFGFLAIAGLCLPVNAYSQADNKATTVYLVRHAEKMKTKDRDPDLTEEGFARAQLLASMLASAGIDIIFSTDYKRTRKTVKPLASSLEVEIQIYNPRDKEFINNLLKEHRGKNILISGHSNTTPSLVNQLLKEEKYEQLDESDYGNLFIVTLIGDSASNVLLTY